MAVNSTLTLPNNVQQVLDVKVEMAFAPTQIFSQVAQGKESENVTGDDQVKGSPVKFTIYGLQNPNTAPLDEVVDPVSKSLSNIQISVTPLEYGDVVNRTSLLNLTSFDNLDLTIPMLVGQTMGEVKDLIARAAMDQQTSLLYCEYANGVSSKASLNAGNIMSSSLFADGIYALDSYNVMKDPRYNDMYVVLMHPLVYKDLRADPTANGFTDLAKYLGQVIALRGEQGEFLSGRIIKTTNVRIDYAANVTGSATAGAAAVPATPITSQVIPIGTITGTINNTGLVTITHTSGNIATYQLLAKGSGNVTIGNCIYVTNPQPQVYRATNAGLIEALAGTETLAVGVTVFTTYFVGYQALAYAFALEPQMRIRPNLNGLGRGVNYGHYGVYGYKPFRNEANFKVFSSASKAVNS